VKNNNRLLLIVGGVVLGVLILGLIINWAWGNSVTNAGNKKEATLSSAYPDAQNTLSDCEVKTTQAANVVGAQSAAVKGILVDAVKGRYDQPSSPQVDSGKLFSAIAEAYPDLTQVSQAYRDMLTVVTGCRTDFRGAQSKLLDQLRDFEAWRNGSWGARHYGKNFPNNNLVARVGNDVPLRGQSAEDKMYQIVLTSSAVKEYQTGQLDPSTYQPFPSSTTTNP